MNMQKFFNIYYTIICKMLFCIFNWIVILMKYTNIYAATYAVAKINGQKIVTQKFFAQKFFTQKLLLQKYIRKNFCGFIFATSFFVSKFFALQLFVSQIFVHLFLIKKQHTPKYMCKVLWLEKC